MGVTYSLYLLNAFLCILKVYSWYNHSRRIRSLFIFLYTLEATAAIVTSWRTLKRLTFDSACVATNLPPDVLVFV